MKQFGLRRFQEFLSRRHIAKQIPHLHGGSMVAARLVHFHDSAETDIGLGAERGDLRTGYYSQAGNRSDAGNGLASKAESGDGLELLFRDEFTGGVPFETEQHIVLIHPVAVVDDPY